MRKRIFLFVISITAALPLVAQGGIAAKQQGHDEAQVYAAVVKELATLKFKYLLSETVPLTLQTDKLPCLTGIQLERLSAKTTHPFNSKVLEVNRGVELLSPSAESRVLKKLDEQQSAKRTSTVPTVLVLSEVLFDKAHRLATLKYMLLCGTKCSSGATLVVERVGSGWSLKGHRPCAFMLNGVESQPKIAVP